MQSSFHGQTLSSSQVISPLCQQRPQWFLSKSSSMSSIPRTCLLGASVLAACACLSFPSEHVRCSADLRWVYWWMNHLEGLTLGDALHGEPVKVTYLIVVFLRAKLTRFARKSSRLHLMLESTWSTQRSRTLLDDQKLRCELRITECIHLVALSQSRFTRGRVIKELGFRRTDLIITTKLFWGVRSGPNDSGLSRKQWAL